jgi:hypothetical protein
MELTDNKIIQSIIKLQDDLNRAIEEIGRLANEVSKSQVTVAVVSFNSPEEERGHVMRFLLNLQGSGITNMLNADSYIQKRFGFTMEKSQTYLFDYIDNYTTVSALYVKPKVETVSPDINSVEVSSPKKRKGPKPYSEMTPEEVAEAKAKKARKAETPALPIPKAKTILKAKKPVMTTENNEEVKAKGVVVWNSFMETVKAEMLQSSGGIDVPYEDVRKRAQEMKEADPESYKLFSENWAK